MPHLEFTDPSGTLWEVWDVTPSNVDVEPMGRCACDDEEPSAARDRAEAESSSRGFRARVREDGRFAGVAGQLSAGWLCFSSASEKRRLGPVPSGWDRFDHEALLQLLR